MATTSVFDDLLNQAPSAPRVSSKPYEDILASAPAAKPAPAAPPTRTGPYNSPTSTTYGLDANGAMISAWNGSEWRDLYNGKKVGSPVGTRVVPREPAFEEEPAQPQPRILLPEESAEARQQAAAPRGTVFVRPITGPQPVPKEQPSILPQPVQRGIDELENVVGVGPFDIPFQGLRDISKGVYQLGDVATQQGLPALLRGDNVTPSPESTRQAAGGVGSLLKGATEIASVALPFAAVSAPLKTAATLAVATAASKGVEEAGKAFGLAPEYSDLAGTVAGLLAGYAAANFRLNTGQQTLMETLRGATPDEAAASTIGKLKAMVDRATPQEQAVASEILKRKYGVDYAPPAPQRQPPPSGTAPAGGRSANTVPEAPFETLSSAPGSPAPQEPPSAAGPVSPPPASPAVPTAPAAAPPPTPAPPVELAPGAVFETPDGKYTVGKIAGNQVLFTYQPPEGKRIIRVLPSEEFRATVGAPLPEESSLSAALAAPPPPAGFRPVSPEPISGTAAPSMDEAVPPSSGVRAPAFGLSLEDDLLQQAPPTQPVPLAPAAAPADEGVAPPEPQPTGMPAAPAAAAAPESHEFSSTQTNLPAPLAQQVRAAASDIPDAQLAEDGREDQPHITVRYGLHGEDPDQVRSLLQGEPPIAATLGKATVFHTDDADVLKVDVESPDLHRLNAKLATLPHTDTHPTYEPHVTMAYLKKGEGAQYEGQDIPGVTGQHVTLPSVAFSSKGGEQTEIPLRGPVPVGDLAPIRNLSPGEAAVQKRAISALKADPQAFLDRYRAQFGDEISADNAAELFPEYRESDEARRDNRTAVARAASWVADRSLRQRIAQDDAKPVVFLAGGTGSGKSTFATQLSKDAGAIVYDSTLADKKGAADQIRAVLDSGRQAEVAYVYRDPIDAYDAVLDRAGAEGAGRVVSPAVHASTHRGAPAAVRSLMEEFQGNPRVLFRFYDNSGTEPVEAGIELLTRGNYTNLKERIEAHDARRTLEAQPGHAGSGKAGERVRAPLAEAISAPSGTAVRGSAPSRPAEQPSRPDDRGVGEGGAVHGARAPGARPIPGEETEVLVPGERQSIRARYEVRELADIHPSHNGLTFVANPSYDLKNEREYSNPENQQRIVENSGDGTFNPRYHITDNPDATNGPAVIDERGNVLGGNGRCMILQRVYNRAGKGAAAYKKLLAQRAPQFGIESAAVRATRQPVLVRVVPDTELESLPGGWKWAVRKTNVTGTAQLSSSERAAADAAQLSPEMLEQIAAAIEAQGPNATLNDALSGRPGTSIVNRLIRDAFFAEQERPALMDGKTGALTQSAKDRIAKAMLGRFFRDSDQIARTPAAIKAKLERIAGPLAKIQGDPAWDLAPAIREAVDLLEYARAHGIQHLGDAVSQQSIFGEAPRWSADAITLARWLRDAKPNDLVRAVRRYVNDREPTMFGEPSPRESFAAAFGQPEAPAALQARIPGFYSQLERTVQAKMPERASIAQVLALVHNPQNGVKADELKWTDFDNFLAHHSGPLTKSQALEYLKANQVQVEEVHYGQTVDAERIARADAALKAAQREVAEQQRKSVPIKEGDRVATVGNAPSRGGYQYSTGKIYEAKKGPAGVLFWKLVGDFGGTRAGRSDKFVRELQAEAKYPWTVGVRANDRIGETDHGVDFAKLWKAEREAELAREKTGEPTKFQKYKLPGGSNYREVLLTLPGRSLTEGGYHSPHWSEPDVVAHVRMADYLTPDGKRVAVMIEDQSDWHEEGRRKGYGPQPVAVRPMKREDLTSDERDAYPQTVQEFWGAFAPDGRRLWISSTSAADAQERGEERITRGVPPAPFGKTWHELVFRRMLRHTVEGDYDAMGWTTGAQQAKLYDLAKQVDAVHYSPEEKRLWAVKDGKDVIDKRVDREEVSDYIGKELAQRLFSATPNPGTNDRLTLTGKGLTVGGDGMKGFYDEIPPQYAAKYVKKWGAAVGEMKLKGVTGKVHSIEITPAMKESVMQGQPLFARAPSAETAADEIPRLPDAPAPRSAPRPDEVSRYWDAAEVRTEVIDDVPVVWANNSAFDLISRRVGTVAMGGNPVEEAAGLALSPTDRHNIAEEAHWAEREPGEAFDTALVRIAQKIAELPPGGIALVQTSPRWSDAEIERARNEERDHVLQMRLPGGLEGLPVKVLDTELGAHAARALGLRGYKVPDPRSPFYDHDRAVMAAEIGVRLMHPKLYTELALTRDQAKELATQFVEELVQRHGDKAIDVTDRMYATLRAYEEDRRTGSEALAGRPAAGDRGATEERPRGPTEVPGTPVSEGIPARQAEVGLHQPAMLTDRSEVAVPRPQTQLASPQLLSGSRAPQLSDARRNIRYRENASTRHHAAAARLEKIPLDPEDAELAVAYVGNPSTMELAGRVLDGRPDDSSAYLYGGIHLSPAELFDAWQRIDAAHIQFGRPPGSRILKDAMENAILNRKSLVIVNDYAGLSDAHRQIAFREEMNHALQFKQTGSLFRHLHSSGFLDSPEGQTAAGRLTAAGYPQDLLAPETGVRLMDTGRYGELGLNCPQARSLGARYIRALRNEYGREAAKPIAERVFEALSRESEHARIRGESQGEHPTLPGSPQPGRKRGPGGGVAPSLSAPAGGDPGGLAPEAPGGTSGTGIPGTSVPANGVSPETGRPGPHGSPGIDRSLQDHPLDRGAGRVSREVAAAEYARDALPASRPGPATPQGGRAGSLISPSLLNLNPQPEVPEEPLPPDGVRLALAKASRAVAVAKDDILKLLAPAAREGAQAAALTVRNRAAEYTRSLAQAEKALQSAKAAFARMPLPARWEFYDRMETGQPEPDLLLRPIAEVFRSLLDKARADVQALGTGKLQKFIENYLPHIYKDPERAEQIFASYFAKRPLEGKKSFLKQRKYETLKEAMDAGLEPISDNPVDMVYAKLAEMQKYVMGHRILHDLKDEGTAVYVPSERMAPQGYAQIDDKIATVFGPPVVSFKESFDLDLMQRLEDLARSLGIQHERKPHIGGQALGYTEEGTGKVTTRSASPESVLIHEIGHQLQFKYDIWNRLRAREYPQRTKELRALADLRYEGSPDVTAAFKRYVRGRDEQMANAVTALLYAPERMKEVAPNTWDFLRDELWHIPELRPLFEARRSMTLGSREVELPISGLRIMGRYWAPEPAARVVNNYLSPGLRDISPTFRGYLALANAMNQFQLGFSAFHLGFTTVDAATSKLALGIYQVAHGYPVKGLLSALKSPLAPFTGIVQGDKFLREYYTPGSQGEDIGSLVNAMVLAGGRAKMDSFYQSQMAGKMMDAFHKVIEPGASLARRAAGAAEGIARSPFAAAELAAKPILEWIVPRQKMAVFADLAEFELQRIADRKLDVSELHAALARAWDSVDNRMGQLVYDNLFWHKVLKDLLMANIRSVGWNTGTIREILGGAWDASKLLRMEKTATGDFRWSPDVTTRFSYVVALPILVGLLGACLYYLWHGKAPEHLIDYYAPPDSHGVRWELPSYMRDVLAVHTEGLSKVAAGKIHEFPRGLAEMLSNKDYFDRPIRNADDPLVKQFEEETNFWLQQWEPMSVRKPFGKPQSATPTDKALPFIGITRAPAAIQHPERKPPEWVHRPTRSPYGKSLPAFASGGIVTEPTKALVGEAGPEKIVDLKQNSNAARSGEDVVRGSSNIPLSAEGEQQAQDLAPRFQAKGGLDRIVSSDLLRARQTAQAVHDATGAPIVYEGRDFHPWHLGEIEGQPTKQVLDRMNRYIVKKPDVPVPGRGSQSTHDGESFNAFKRRALGAFRELLAALRKNPEERIGVFTHYRDLKLLESWIRKGAAPSMEIDAKHMASKGDPPGSVERLYLVNDKARLQKIDMASDAKLPGGIYVVRHGKTLWNGEAGAKLVTKPTITVLAKHGPQAVVPLGKAG